MNSITENILKFQTIQQDFEQLKTQGMTGEMKKLIISVLENTNIDKNNLKLIFTHMIDEVYHNLSLESEQSSKSSVGLLVKAHSSSEIQNSNLKNAKIQGIKPEQKSKDQLKKKLKEEVFKVHRSNFLPEKNNKKSHGTLYKKPSTRNNSIVNIYFSSPKSQEKTCFNVNDLEIR